MPPKPWNFEESVRQFHAKVAPPNDQGCMLWTGEKSHSGYGRASWMGKKGQIASRIAYLIANGSLPEGLSVLHKCDVPACVNPKHLFLGTQKENALDCARKGRMAQPKGDAHCCAKLTTEQVLEIRRLHSLGHSRKDLGPKFGVGAQYIGEIVRRKRWAHV